MFCPRYGLSRRWRHAKAAHLALRNRGVPCAQSDEHEAEAQLWAEPRRMAHQETFLRDWRFCIQIKRVTFTESDVTARRFHLFGTQYVASETRVGLYWQRRSSSHICPVLPYGVGGRWGGWQTIIGLIQNRLVREGKRRRHCHCFQKKGLNAAVNRKHWEMRSQESNEADQSAVIWFPLIDITQ